MCWWGRIVCGGDAQCEEVWHDEVVQKEPGVGGGGGSSNMGKEGTRNRYEVLCPQNLPTASLCVSMFYMYKCVYRDAAWFSMVVIDNR